MKQFLVIVGALLLVAVFTVGGWVWRYFVTPQVRGIENTIDTRIQKMDDKTRYETMKKVEDTCRAMMASYNTDSLTYEQYKDNANEEKQSWAEQAKMRANKTASTYNNYILENSFIWADNVPGDIQKDLAYLE